MTDHTECHRLIHTLSDYVDGELDESLCKELEKHLEGCENCRIVVDTMKKTISLYHEEKKAECCPQDIRQRLYKRLDLEDYINK